MPSRFMARATSVAALLALLFAAGCGGPKTTTVNGTVKYQGKPLVCGNVTLAASNGATFAGDIQFDGTYTIPAVPTGNVKIGVTSMDPNARPEAVGRTAGRGTDAAGGKKAAGAGGGQTKTEGWFPIPEKFMDPNKSGLTGSVETGKALDIDLK